jgi:uncharacterized membrane protein (UPF0127 family)
MHTEFSTLRQFVAATALTVCAATAAQAQDAPQMELPRTTLTAGMYRLDVQIAATPQSREIGLMFRREMPQQEGMLFAFSVPAVQCFWMKNTILPLTAAFIADDGTIVNLADMKAQTTDSHCSTKPVKFVLEMNQGWFAHKGFKAGTQLSGPPFEARR